MNFLLPYDDEEQDRTVHAGGHIQSAETLTKEQQLEDEDALHAL